MDQKLHYKIKVTGQVQGVGYRWNAARIARNFGITGFIRNKEDGSVFIEAEGLEKGLNDFIEWCRKGPRSGYVESVKVEEVQIANFTDFRIE